MSRGQRSAACTATDAVPTDDTNRGTAPSDAAKTAVAPATVASTPGRRTSSHGARRHGADDSVISAARTLLPIGCRP